MNSETSSPSPWTRRWVVGLVVLVVIAAAVIAWLSLAGSSVGESQASATGSEAAPEPMPEATPEPMPEAAPTPEAAAEADEAAPEPMLPSFPWPPPRASAQMLIPDDLLPSGPEAVLGSIDDVLRGALLGAGYSDLAYFRVPSGFALVTRVEQFELDGSPSPGAGRWIADLTAEEATSLLVRLRRFFFVEPGYFRLLVFVVSPEAFRQREETASRDEAVAWMSRGTPFLPSELAERAIEPHTKATLLVYEYEQPDDDAPATARIPGQLSARVHLDKAGVWARLGN